MTASRATGRQQGKVGLPPVSCESACLHAQYAWHVMSDKSARAEIVKAKSGAGLERARINGGTSRKHTYGQ